MSKERRYCYGCDTWVPEKKSGAFRANDKEFYCSMRCNLSILKGRAEGKEAERLRTKKEIENIIFTIEALEKLTFIDKQQIKILQYLKKRLEKEPEKEEKVKK